MIIISIIQQEKEFTALEQAAKFAALLRPTVDGQRGNWQHKKLLIPPKLNEPRSAFADIAADFSKFVAEDNVTVFVSQVHPMQLNPLLSQGMESLLAMLILAFPEVRWFFGTIRGYDKSDSGKLDDFRKAHGLHNLFRPEQSALFDGSGLRDWVRQRAIEHPQTERDAQHLARRTQLAVALDEETDYAHLHAYTAYRFGFRAMPLCSLAQAKAVLGDGANWPELTIVFEDIFLNLPDGKPGYSWLRKCPKTGVSRSEDLKRVEKAQHRLLVTSGQRLHGDDEKWADNEAYLAEQRAAGVRVKKLHKPHAGIFRIWEQAGLHHALKWRDSDFWKMQAGESDRLHKGVGLGFVWPPVWDHWRDGTDGDGSGHSCPGILLQVAQHMVDRAERLLPEVYSVEEAALGAALATDALELLGGKTPTMSVAALALKHQFEVTAVCQFSGVEYHFPVKPRLKEIQRDVDSIGQWFHPSQRRRARLNAEMIIMSEMVKVFREHGQYDEEQLCMNRVRWLHNTLWMRENPARLILWPIVRYIEFLLGSFSRFVAVLALWILLFSWLYVISAGHGGWAPGLQDAITSFFSIGGPIHQQSMEGEAIRGSLYVWMTCSAILLGFIHLGIFISHLYTVVSRK